VIAGEKLMGLARTVADSILGASADAVVGPIVRVSSGSGIPGRNGFSVTAKTRRSGSRSTSSFPSASGPGTGMVFGR
jgi:hypothetical protein